MPKSVPKVPTANGNTNSPSPAKNWFFTWNNYKENDGDELFRYLSSKCSKILFQEEIGNETGTKHLQGNITLLKKDRWEHFTPNNKIHWEKTRNVSAAFDYCMKEDTRNGKMWHKGINIPVPIRVISELRNWQKSIENIHTQSTDDRTVNWIYDPIGNNGKSSYIKYAVNKYGCIFSKGGKNNDIINLVFNQKDYLLNNEITTVFFDFPRDIDPSYISYQAIESIKDGLIQNNKFETGSFICNPPHIIIFSNQLPMTNRLTPDRWNIYSIENNNLVVFNIE